MQRPSPTSHEIDNGAAVAPADLVRSDILFDGDADVSSLHCEAAAVRELASVIDDEHLALKRFLDVVVGVTGAGSAGITSIETDANGVTALRWSVISGAMSDHQSFVTTRASSPCGVCLDRAKPVLLQHPERAFAYLSELAPFITELLIVPLDIGGGVPIGTLWLSRHDHATHFCADDVRIAVRLALHLAAALQRCSRSAEHRRALNGRDILLRDAHHRVMNTLQMAVSMLRAEVPPNPALYAASERLRMLAKVHESLAVSGEERVELTPLLRTIATAANEQFSNPGREVRVRLEVEPFTLSSDDAIPLALLVNEAVTNACKHAFPNAAKGIIRVAVKMEAATSLVIRIADDGVGLPDQRLNGLGLKLIRSFADQVGALVTFEVPVHGTGTSIVVRMQTRPDYTMHESGAASAHLTLSRATSGPLPTSTANKAHVYRALP